jgi:indole-3-glycerol phosphate synthase
MDILAKIIEAKRRRLVEAKATTPPPKMQARALQIRSSAPMRRLSSAVKSNPGISIIAEIKRASPSKGAIREDVDAAELAKTYASGGAAAISVLTEEDHFRGSLADLEAVRQAVTLPLLRKDFIFDEYQVYESAVSGADSLLLIVAALEDEMLFRLRRLTEEELGMDALVEVHTAEEMDRAIQCGARLIGVNNRDLITFKVSLDTSVKLAPLAPAAILLISESGIESKDDIHRLSSLGYRGFLIGESLMRAADPKSALRCLLSSSVPQEQKAGT